MGWVVDLLGSEYHWSKKDILSDIYLDDLFIYIRKIAERKIANIKLQMVIVQNPHVKDPKKLWVAIETAEKQLPGQKKSEEFDAAGFELLKAKLRQNPRFIVKS